MSPSSSGSKLRDHLTTMDDNLLQIAVRSNKKRHCTGKGHSGLNSDKMRKFLLPSYITTLALATILSAHLLHAESIDARIRSPASLSVNRNSVGEITRVRRQSSASDGRTDRSESLLTVEWEGIQSGDHPDSAVRGFIVEYRAEKESQWNVHSGVIPYKGPNHQYRVQIPRLPTGISYFVRIKVLGAKNEVLVETPEIRARNEIVSIKCDSDEITAPRDVEMKERGQFSVALAWLPPECGSVGEYQIELRGKHHTSFDVHRQTVAQPSASITGLFSGTKYSVRVRAVDRARVEGPWNEELLRVTTKGDEVPKSSDISVEYKSNTDARIRWKHLDDERLQHYEVIFVEQTDNMEVKRVERTRVSPVLDSFYFAGLSPLSEYSTAVVAYVDHEPRLIYHINFTTAENEPVELDEEPVVVKESAQNYQIHWKMSPKHSAKKFIVEYRLKGDDAQGGQKWVRAQEEREANDEDTVYSITASADELADAFSVRVTHIDEEGMTIARTRETLVVQGDEAACDGAGGTVRGINVESTANTLTFSWKEPECDKSKGKIVGYEYSIWKQEDGSPPAETSFTETPTVIVEELPTQTAFLFRVRSRLGNAHSPWSKIVEGLTVEPELGENIYRLRIVLSPPKSYIVWTPLNEHRDNIANFKLSYKNVNQDEWIKITKPPSFFRCPPNVAQANDFCHDLNELEYGKQYTADLIYELHNSEWTSHGSPLLFILVEAGEETTLSASRPLNLRLTPNSETSVEVRWMPPESNAQIHAFEVTAEELRADGKTVARTYRDKISGSSFSHVFTRLSPQANYNISVRAISETWGGVGDAVSELFSFPESVKMASQPESIGESGPNGMDDPVKLFNAQAEEGPALKVVVSWQVTGDLNSVRAYQIEQSSESDSIWRPASPYITNTPGQQTYRSQFDKSALVTADNIKLRISAIGSNGKPIASSMPVSISAECSTITETPKDVALVRKSADTVALRWAFPTRLEGCGLYFIVSGTIDGTAVQRTIEGRAREHRFDGSSSNGWHLQIAAANRLGVGPTAPGIATLLDIPAATSQRAATTAAVKAAVSAWIVDAAPSSLSSSSSSSSSFSTLLLSPSANRIARHRRSICDPRNDYWCRGENYSLDLKAGGRSEALISQPFVSQEGAALRVRWRSVGNGRNVFGYRVLYRTPGQNTGWNPFGQIVPYVGDDQEYSQTLTGLYVGLTYEIKIQALDRNSYVLSDSNEVEARSSCQSPSHPPTQVTVDAPDARHVRVTWNAPPQSSWHCDTLRVEIQVDEPRGAVSAPIIVDARQNSHIFDAQPNSVWSVRARAVNSAGVSAWSASVSTRSGAATADALIDGPFVTTTQGIPRLSWRSRATDPQVIDHFVVEWKPRTAPNWKEYSYKVPYTGNQRAYTTDLTQLPKGQILEVRVKALDHNLGVTFVSPSTTLQSSPACLAPPRSPPRYVDVTPIGPTQIRLSWQPIAEAEWNCDRIWYVVRYSSPETQGFRNLTEGESSTVFDSKPYTQWQFEIQAANPVGASSWSRAQGSQTLTSAPGPILDLNAYPLADSVQLSWRPPQNPNGQVTGYEVTYQLISQGMCDNTPDTRIVTLSSDRPTFTLSQLHPHSKYRVGVAARTNIAGERVTREIQTDQAVPISGPAHVRVDNVAESSADLSWHAPPCITTNGDISEYEYEVVAADRFATTVPRISEMSRSTRIQLRGLIPGTRYLAKVRAFTSRGAGPWSPDVTFETARGGAASSPLQLPQHNARIVSSGAADTHLVWQTTPQTAGYYDKFTCRWQATNAPPKTPPQQRTFPAYSPCEMEVIRRQQLPPSTSSQQTHCGRIDGLRSDEGYNFELGVKPKGQPQQWQPLPSVIVGPVQITSLTKLGGTSSSLHFTWTVRPADQQRVTAYRITVIPSDRREPPRTFNVDRNTLQYHVSGLKSQTVYSVTVEAATQNEYHPGVAVDMSTDAELPFGIQQRPRILDEKPSAITIAWDVPTNIQCSSFIVEYRVESGGWQRDERQVPCERARQTYTTTIQGLPMNSAVDLRVVGVSLQNQPSTPSPEVRGHTKCSAPDRPPQALRLDAPSTNEVRVSWARLAKNMWNCDQMNVDVGYRVGDQPERIITIPGDKTDHLFPAEPNSRWTVRLRASNQVGVSPWGPEQSIMTRQGAPGTVRDLRLQPVSPNEIRVSWLPPAEQRGQIVGYDISYRLKHRLACQDEEPRDVSRDFVTIYNHKDLDYTLNGLLPNSLYEVRVRARTTELGPEESKEAATLQQPPSAPPLNLQLTYALERSLNFQWEPVDCSQRHGEILNYEFEIIGQDDWAKLERQIANTSGTRVTIDGLTPFTKYVMRVKAYNGIGGGPNTENLDVMTAKANAPLPPQDLVVTQEGTDFFVVSWLPPYPPYGPHDSYKLRYQLLSENTWKNIEVSSKDPRLECPAVGPRYCFNITDLLSGQQYRVQVAARIEGGVYGPYSAPIIANTLQILPDAPQAIELIAKTEHSLHVKWTPPVDLHGHITQYRLTYTSMAEPNARSQTVIVDYPQMDYNIKNLQPETTYKISLSAGTKRGFGPDIWTQFATDPFRIPAIMTAPVLTPEGAHTLNVEWRGVTDAKNRVAGYIIELRAGDNPIWSEYGGVVRHEPGKHTYYNKLTSLSPDTLYFVRIKVVDNRQRISDASPEAQARTGCAAPISPPTNINLQSPEWHQVGVSWQSPSKGSWFCSSIRYRVEFTNGTQPTRQVEVPGSMQEHKFDSGPNTEWVIRMRTENDAGESGWSDVLRIKTAGGAPSAVTDMRATPTGPTEGEVTWRAPDEPNGEITGYTIVYQLRAIGECGPSTAKPLTVHSHEERVDLKDLLPDSTYDIYVTAHTTHEGPKSKVVTMRTQEDVPGGHPRNLRVTSVTSKRAELLWNEIECELRHGKILGYNYELEALNDWGGANISEQTPAHRVSFDSLAPYTEYRARVRGQNSQGVGPFTDWVTFQTLPAAPPPPTDLREEELMPHALEISFLAPSPPNGVLDLYRVRYTPRDKFNYKEIKVPAFEQECSDALKRGRLCYRISKLEPEEEYEVQVAAHTERGDWSDWSESLFTKTNKQNIPVLEQELQLDFVKSTSIGVKWHGLEEPESEHILGYVLEFKSESDADWAEHNGIVRHRPRQNDYRVTVRNLIESTEYFFRLRVVGKGEKRGSPGPELKAVTKCGKPEQPPSNVRIEPIDFESIRFTWENPDESTWKCDAVEVVLHYSNSTSQGTLTIPVDEASQREVIFETLPGTRWEGKMRTQTVEEDAEPNHSKWSNRATLVTKSAPSEIFVKVLPKGPTKAEVNWDLPEEYQDWKYGVDIAHRPIKIGGCKGAEVEEHATPIVLENVQEKQVFLDDLIPGTEYEVTVTLRRPPNLPANANFPAKKTTRRFKTEDATPTGAPRSLRVEARLDTKLTFSWEPPECLEQNGEITQYEYDVTGLDDWNKGTTEGTSPRTRTDVTNLLPGSLYRFRVRAFTSAGTGPWSEPVDARTTGSEIGAPRELSAIATRASSIQLTWLPPHPETSTVIAYRLKYSPRTDDSRPVQVELSGDDLTCTGFVSPILTPENLCTTVNGLQPSTTYRFSVQAQSSSGNWGPWSSDHFSTTRQTDDTALGGSLRLLSAGHDNLKVKWIPPAVIGEKIDEYEVFIAVAHKTDRPASRFSTPGSQTSFHFKDLNKVTLYNVTIQGVSQSKKLWFISGNFATTDITDSPLAWLTAPMDLRLIEKSETMLHVTWNPPEIFEPEYRDLLTHYRVTIAPVDTYTREQGPARNYTVKVPGNSIRFDDLHPETVYNITVQGGTEVGYGEMIWGAWSTLASGQIHILRLKDRTPTTLTVEWDPVWGTAHSGYILTAKSLSSIYTGVGLNTVKTYDVDAIATEFVIGGLDPATTYNVTLRPKEHHDSAWGVYSTLPPGWYLPRNLKHCDRTNHATSMSWEPVDLNLATHYQVRYIHLNQQRAFWTEEPEKHRKHLLCPKDPCNRLCYLVFNLPHHPDEFAFQVRAKVNGIWNRWKLAARLTVSDAPEIKENCCIVPPPYHVENIGHSGTSWEVPVAPAATEKNITRYYVVVDERDPPGDTNWTQLTDKVTANRLKIPYYVAASFNTETLTAPTNVKLGDGQVIGGYVNYPLTKGKTYNYEIYQKWMLAENQPVVARIRGVQNLKKRKWSDGNINMNYYIIASPYLTAGWPWWWLLLLLLLLLLCILLTCFLLWCLQGRRRRHHAITNGQRDPLLPAEKEQYGRSQFEDGYSQGYRDARDVGSGTAARQRLRDDYGQRDDRFHEGYSKGLRDGGFKGMTSSMSNLAQRPASKLGYSSGYMQGFRDGNKGTFGDRITDGLLKRLDEQYPNNDEFKQGYIDGFKDGVHGGRTFEDSRRLQQSLTELTERLTSLEKTKGDEIHSTKIYHVYNQQPDVVGYSSTGEQLTHELEEITTGGAESRRSTLRRHYTPGDYLKYESDYDGAYNSLGRTHRSLSASALGRGESGGSAYRQRHLSGTSYISRASGIDKAGASATADSRRYNYRSRSDVGGGASPSRYASQTLLDGARPGPAAPHASRHDALQSLQRELDSLSRSPAGAASTAHAGYNSDTAAASSSQHYQQRSATRSGYDYDSEIAVGDTRSASSWKSSRIAPDASRTTLNTIMTTRMEAGVPRGDSGNDDVESNATHSLTRRPELDSTRDIEAAATKTAYVKGGHNWPNDLIDIVHEPMDQTLSRMRRFSNSVTNVQRGGTPTATSAAASHHHHTASAYAADGDEKELVSEKFHRTYKEEYSSGSH